VSTASVMSVSRERSKVSPKLRKRQVAFEKTKAARSLFMLELFSIDHQ